MLLLFCCVSIIELGSSRESIRQCDKETQSIDGRQLDLSMSSNASRYVVGVSLNASVASSVENVQSKQTIVNSIVMLFKPVVPNVW